MKSESKTNKKSVKIVFLYAIAITWLLIPLMDISGKYLLDSGFFAFRAWEVLTRRADGIGLFKSSAIFEKTIYGDLSHMLKVREYRNYRHQIFSTDSYGFRNKEFSSDTYYPIITIGDSNMAGASLSDEEVFSSHLEKKLNTFVYNYAPSSIIQFLSDERFAKNPPKIVIWEQIEREILANNYRQYVSLPNQLQVRPLKKHNPNNNFKMPQLSSFFAQQIFNEFRWYMFDIKPDSISYIDKKSRMLFFKPSISILNMDENERGIDEIVKGIKQVKTILNNRGIQLIYLPLPDKENIYSYILPCSYETKKKKRVFLKQLHKRLTNAGVNTLNIYENFSSSAKQDKNRYLYFRDDTHWNAFGVKTAVEVTAKYINDHSLMR